MEFIKFKKRLQDNFEILIKEATHLFEVDLDKDELWDLYLDSFPEGTNEIFRERREYDCSCCRQFIKGIGNVVAIKDNKIKTIWDLDADSSTFQPVADALSKLVKSKDIGNVWVNKFKSIGTDSNKEMLDSGKVLEWDHFYLDMPNKFIDTSKETEGELRSQYKSTRDVFSRSLNEITEDSVLTVLELIAQNSLYKGEEWKSVLEVFLKHKQSYSKLKDEEDKSNYSWEKSVIVGESLGRIRNHSIGTLLVNISEGMGLDLAVRKYESIVAPENYKRSKPIYSKKMLEDAQKTVQELGYMDSLSRRYAILDDITVNNILFSNKDSAKRIGGMDLFEEMLSEVAVNPKNYSKVEEVSIDTFISDILPNAKELELLLENKHSSNMASLIAPTNKNSKSMFKWNNGFSWGYTGNITDSSMKDNVKLAGGNVDGVLRFSIQWNDGSSHDGNDLDAHCIDPNGNHIFYGNKRGNLDVDIMTPKRNVPAVENITWGSLSQMSAGTYEFFVHNYSHRGGREGFKAEIEFNGQIFSFSYNKNINNREKVAVAEVRLDKQGNFTITEKLPSSVSSREVWGLKTNQFIPVSVVMHSPNYWDSQDGIGNKHYMFMLKNCINPENPNGMFVEFLQQDLVKHRKVFEALFSKAAVKDNEDQLSGVGFSSTQRNEVTVKVKGVTERILKVKF